MKITWYGTAAVALNSGGADVLFDPFVPWKGSKVPVGISDYDGFSDICVTHGHFDHIESIPEIIRRNPDTAVYCTKAPYGTLREKGVPRENLKKLRPGKEFYIGEMRIRTYQSRHALLQINRKDRLLDRRLAEYFYNIPHAVYGDLKYPENGEILMYEICAEGKKVCLLGSMNTAEEVIYPSSCDVLILPYAGYVDNYSEAVKIIKLLKPEKVILTHFDDTFPPISRTVRTEEIENYAGCEIIVPEYKNPVAV